MAKTLIGKVVTNKMQNTIVVEVLRFVPHPLYKKLLRKSKRFNVESFGQKFEIGQEVKITETKPVSKNKYFAVVREENKPAVSVQKKAVKTRKEKKA